MLHQPTLAPVRVLAVLRPEWYLAQAPDSREELSLVQSRAVALDLVWDWAHGRERAAVAGFSDEHGA